MKIFCIVVCAFAMAASYLIVRMPPPFALELLHEDGPIEQATVFFFLIACTAFVRAWKRHGGETEGRRVFYLMLAALMFVCAGEEMSWGQRIVGWQTPESWSRMNAQAETNLHNLAVIEGGVRDPKTQSLLRTLTNANRLFALFWLTFFVLVPVLDRTSRRAHALLARLGLPIAPLWMGGLFVFNHVAFFVANRHLDAIGPFTSDAFPLDELKEHHDALVFAIAGCGAWWRARASALTEKCGVDRRPPIAIGSPV